MDQRFHPRIAAMADTRRPLSPHLQIYKWQVQMVTSILHRATGIALAVGTCWWLGLLHLAAASRASTSSRQCRQPARHDLADRLDLGAFLSSMCNGIRHLIQDAGAGYAIPQFVRSSWLSVVREPRAHRGWSGLMCLTAGGAA
jgi:succinate dehydrogenase / fumarate reductase cytochrome b subunit